MGRKKAIWKGKAPVKDKTMQGQRTLDGGQGGFFPTAMSSRRTPPSSPASGGASTSRAHAVRQWESPSAGGSGNPQPRTKYA